MYFDRELIGEKRLFLVLSSPEKLKENNISIIQNLIQEHYRVIVVTSNQPYAILRKLYEKNGVDLGSVYFIDTITRYAVGRAPEGVSDCRFVNSPSNLTDLGIVITEVLNTMAGEKPCILFDSVSTMLIYIPSINISKFIHFVTSKLRLIDASGIFMAVEKGLDPLLLTQLTTYVDETLDMDSNKSAISSKG